MKIRKLKIIAEKVLRLEITEQKTMKIHTHIKAHQRFRASLIMVCFPSLLVVILE